jgi:transcriptional regulator with XRE-family HTH domain
MSILEKRIGGKITEFRLEKKLTQSELAELIGISVESISRLERGVTFPSLKTIEKISEALKVQLKSFFDFDEYAPGENTYERELSKLLAFLRTLDENELNLSHKILKDLFRHLKRGLI